MPPGGEHEKKDFKLKERNTELQFRNQYVQFEFEWACCPFYLERKQDDQDDLGGWPWQTSHSIVSSLAMTAGRTLQFTVKQKRASFTSGRLGSFGSRPSPAIV